MNEPVRNKETDAITEKKIDARLILSIVAAGIMSFSGVVVETAMNVTFPTLMEESRCRSCLTLYWSRCRRSVLA